MTDTKPKIKFLDVNNSLVGQGDDLAIKRTQDLDDSWLDYLKDYRTASANTRTRDFELAAEIPVAVVEKWAREGFDIHREPWKNIRKKLIAEDLGYFIASAKAL